MENTNTISKRLINAVLFSYVFIMLPLEKWNLLLGQVIVISPLGLPYFPDIFYFPFGYLSFILTGLVLIPGKPVTGKKIILVRISIMCYYVPLIVYHCIEPFSIKRFDPWFYIIPEIVFIFLSIVLFIQTLGKHKK